MNPRRARILRPVKRHPKAMRAIARTVRRHGGVYAHLVRLMSTFRRDVSAAARDVLYPKDAE